MLRSLISFFFLLSSIEATALETTVNKPNGPVKGLVIIAPAKKYLMQERLFSQLAVALASRGFLTVRFNWSTDTLQNPEFELQRAARDIQNVTVNAQRAYGYGPEQTVLISKSFSSKAVDPSVSLARSHILLTPNCSAEAPFYRTYRRFLQKPDIHLKMFISVDDPYCDVNEIYQTLNAIGRPQLLAITKGDHNFVVLNSATGTPNYVYQDLVVGYVSDFIIGSLRTRL